jgi:predicted PurR-regulated permease PerM
MSFPGPSEKQARVIWLAASGVALAILVALVVGLIWGLGKVLNVLSPVLWPLAVAGVIAYLLDPVVDFLERKGSPRPRAILVVFATALFIVVGLAASIVPQLVSETQQLVEKVPAYTVRLEQRVANWINHNQTPFRRFLGPLPFWRATNEVATTNQPADETITNAVPAPKDPSNSLLSQALQSGSLQSAGGWLAKALPKIGAWLFGQMSKVASWFGVLAGLALVPIYAFYFLLEKHGIQKRWTTYLPVTDSSFKDELVFVLQSINDYLIAFFRGQVLVAICDGVLYTIGFSLIGLPYALLLGVVAIGLTMIPFLGAILTCVTALVLALVQYGDWLHPLLVLSVFGVVQALEGLVISPRIMGERVGLHPLAIIVALMVGTNLFGGILGGILAIPLAAALRVILFRYIWKRPGAPPGTPPSPSPRERPDQAPAG